MADYEGRWRCDHCGSENLGSQRQCRSCGTSIGEDVRFYLPENAEPLRDGALIREAGSGVAWHCDHCGSMNMNLIDGVRVASCKTCGNARDAGDRNRQTGDVPAGRDRADGAILEELPNEWKRRRRREIPASPIVSGPGESGSVDAGTPGGRPRWLIPVLLGLAALVVLLLSLFAPVATVESEIVHRHWERSRAVEELTTLQKSGFDPPADARIHSRDWRFSHTVQVPSGSERYACGTTDNGNGYFSTKYCTRTTYRTESVYDWHYSYEIDRWLEIQRKQAYGTDSAPFWPDLHPRGLKQRLTSGTATYLFEIDIGEEENSRVAVPLERWSASAIGQGIPVRVNVWGRVLWPAD